MIDKANTIAVLRDIADQIEKDEGLISVVGIVLAGPQIYGRHYDSDSHPLLISALEMMKSELVLQSLDTIRVANAQAAADEALKKEAMAAGNKLLHLPPRRGDLLS